MRYASRVGRLEESPNVVSIRPEENSRGDQEELTAFRGFVLAATASAIVWGLCLTALWLAIWRE